MDRVRVYGWLLPTLLCVGLSVVYMFEWRASRSEQRLASDAFSRTVKGFQNRFTFESTQTRSILSRLSDAVERLSRRVEGTVAPGASQELAEAPTEDAAEAPAATEDGQEPWRDLAYLSPEEDATLPRVPDGIVPVGVVESIDLREFYANPVFNPEGVELDILERHRASNLAAHAKARLITRESDFLLLTAEETPRLLEEGMYIDYARGEKKDVIEGAFTIGHPLPDGGTRVFLFFHDRYPVLKEIKQEMKRVAKNTVRHLMGIVAR